MHYVLSFIHIKVTSVERTIRKKKKKIRILRIVTMVKGGKYVPIT